MRSRESFSVDFSEKGKDKKMGWIHARDEERDQEWKLANTTDSGNFKGYIPEQVVVSLSIGDHRFEREISEDRKILNQRINGKRYDHIVDLKVSPNEVPDVFLEGISREAFIAKWEARLGKDGWNVYFIPQDDGSYAADEDFFEYIVSDIVKRCK